MSGLILAGKASLCKSILVARRSSGILPSSNLKRKILAMYFSLHYYWLREGPIPFIPESSWVCFMIEFIQSSIYSRSMSTHRSNCSGSIIPQKTMHEDFDLSRCKKIQQYHSAPFKSIEVFYKLQETGHKFCKDDVYGAGGI